MKINLCKKSGVHYSLVDDRMGSKHNVNNNGVQLSIPSVVNSSIVWKFFGLSLNRFGKNHSFTILKTFPRVLNNLMEVATDLLPSA